MSKRILITGGAGFIGVNAARRFHRDGWEVLVFDDFSRRGTDLNAERLTSDCKDRLTIVHGDVRNAGDVQPMFRQSVDAVLHLAAQVAVTTSVTDPATDFSINAVGTFTLLEAIRSSGQKPVTLFASTNKVYGSLDGVPVKEENDRYAFTDRAGVTEDQPLDFHSPYGCSKGAADQYVHDYARIYGIPTIVFRQSCIYGPHQMGIEDQGWVAWFMIAALLKRPMTIYGTGKQVRDLLYIDDLTNAFASALERSPATAGRVYNIGGGPTNTLSLVEFLAILREDFGLDVNPLRADERPGDQPIFISDNTRAANDFGWKPAMNVRDGIASLHAWLTKELPSIEKLYR